MAPALFVLWSDDCPAHVSVNLTDSLSLFLLGTICSYPHQQEVNPGAKGRH